VSGEDVNGRFSKWHHRILPTAAYAFEHLLSDVLYLHPVQAAIARGRITSIDASEARALPRVILVLTHENAPRLSSDEDKELWVLQSDEVHFRGQFIGAAIAETQEIARHAASLVRVAYAAERHDVALRADRQDLYKPKQVNPSFATDTSEGDVEQALREASITIDQTYTTPAEQNNPLEPHTTVAVWEENRLTLYDSTQGVHVVRTTLAPIFGLEPDQIRVIAPHVGGGFGSKGTPHAHEVLVGLAATMVPGRAVKFALTRQQMFSAVGYRTPTIQRIRLGADREGKIEAIAHDVIEVTSRVKEFAEQTAVPSRMMYAAPNRRTTHRLAALDVPVPSWMRAPGEEPGMFAAEVAMDELAEACGVDPVELRIRNDPETDPESSRPWSGRNLVGCLREGARRFGWERRTPSPGMNRENGWFVGMGVASSTYPRYMVPGSQAAIQYRDGRYTVRIGAADIGTGSWTALAQIAADALGCPFEMVRMELGDSALPMASVEGGSSGITSWGMAIVTAARAFRAKHGEEPRDGVEVSAEEGDDSAAKRYAMHSFGAQFAEVQVHADTGEIRVPRMLGVFSVGRIINPRTARSQLIGGMTMGLSAALHEESVRDPRFGHVVNQDLAAYHIATSADVRDIDAVWLDECDEHSNPMGSRGIGEIGIVGAAAAIANGAYNATGIRIRDLPITPDKLMHQD
jgi:xanthine dehydrogenase YagR molybdenum-binding subunit